jgi:NAD(P)-dependent dehydrogenase (short-subunit alcohol dehydrogenase family)
MAAKIDALRVALVTGGSRGIGQALSVTLAKHGYGVIVVGRTPDRVEHTIDLLTTRFNDCGVTHLGLAMDVNSEKNVSEIVSQSLAHFGRIDVLIACAGIGKKSGSTRIIPHPFHNLPLDEWEEVLGINLTGLFLINRECARTMINQGGGQIINICSSTTPAGLRGTAYAPAYCASKFGVVGLTESLSAEVGRYGVRVQAVFPGPVDTPLVDDTRLARPFGGSLSAETFAEILFGLIEQPLDSTIIHPHILPFTDGIGSRRNETS